MARVYGCHLPDARERHTAPVDICVRSLMGVDGGVGLRARSCRQRAGQKLEVSISIVKMMSSIWMAQGEAGGSVGLFD